VISPRQRVSSAETAGRFRSDTENTFDMLGSSSDTPIPLGTPGNQSDTPAEVSDERADFMSIGNSSASDGTSAHRSSSIEMNRARIQSNDTFDGTGMRASGALDVPGSPRPAGQFSTDGFSQSNILGHQPGSGEQ